MFVCVKHKAPGFARAIHNGITDHIDTTFSHSIINCTLDILVFHGLIKLGVGSFNLFVNIIDLINVLENSRTMVSIVEQFYSNLILHVLLMLLSRLILGTLHDLIEILDALINSKQFLYG